MSVLNLSPISIQNSQKIIEQMKTCVCLISKNNKEEEEGTGFICQLPYPEKDGYYKCLIVGNNLVSISDINNNININIKIYLNNKDKKFISLNIDKSRYLIESKKLSITFIEIKDPDDNIKAYFELDENINKEESYYKDIPIYILNYGENNDIFVSYGIMNNFKENNISINYYKKENSIIPILSLDSFKLIGFIHSLTNRAILINYLYSEFLLAYYEKIKLNKITAIYKVEKDNQKISIFHEDFVKINKDNCIIIVEGERISELCPELKIDEKLKEKKEIKVELIQFNIMTDLFSMFAECSNLIELPDVDNLNLEGVISLRSIFFGCSSIIKLPDISKWNTKDIVNMRGIFNGCKLLSSLPDISQWNTNNVTNMSCLFCRCSSLSYIPDISNWKTSRVINMSNMFDGCCSLISLPNISSWDTSNVEKMQFIFANCSNLNSLPDIAGWNTNKLKEINYILSECKKLNTYLIYRNGIWKMSLIFKVYFLGVHL